MPDNNKGLSPDEIDHRERGGLVLRPILANIDNILAQLK